MVPFIADGYNQVKDRKMEPEMEEGNRSRCTNPTGGVPGLRSSNEMRRGGNHMADLTLDEFRDKAFSEAELNRLMAEEAERMCGHDLREKPMEEIHFSVDDSEIFLFRTRTIEDSALCVRDKASP